jgi:hypothetical protein
MISVYGYQILLPTNLKCTIFKQENISYQLKCGLKIITTSILHSQRGVPPRPFMVVIVKIHQKS